MSGELFLDIKNTRNGKGIFIKKDFKKNEIIYKVKGKKVSIEYAESMGREFNANTFRFDKNFYISPENEIGDFQNHSCNPNAYLKKINDDLFILAIGDISKGHEVLLDYSTIIANDDEWDMVCNCEDVKCRKIIKKFSTLEKELQDKYIRMGIVPDYIIK